MKGFRSFCAEASSNLNESLTTSAPARLPTPPTNPADGIKYLKAVLPRMIECHTAISAIQTSTGLSIGAKGRMIDDYCGTMRIYDFLRWLIWWLIHHGHGPHPVPGPGPGPDPAPDFGIGHLGRAIFGEAFTPSNLPKQPDKATCIVIIIIIIIIILLLLASPAY